MSDPTPHSDERYRWDIIEAVIVIRARSGRVDVAVFDRFLVDLREAPIDTVFAVSTGRSMLSAVQRHESAEIFKRRGIRTHVVTDSALTRGIVTAVSWLGADIFSYSWSDLKRALAQLKVSDQSYRRIEELAKAFRDEATGGERVAR